MDDKKDIVKDFFKERLKDYAEPVRLDLWASLEDHVPGKQTSRKGMYVAIASVAAVLLLGVLLYPLFIQKADTATDSLAYFTEEIQQPVEEEPIKEYVLEQGSSPKSIRQATTVSFAKDIPLDNTENKEVTYTDEEVEIKDKVAEKKEYQTMEQQPSTHRNRYNIPKRRKTEASSFQLSVAGNGLLAMNTKLDQTDISNSSQLRMYSNQMNIGYSNQQGPTVDELTNITYHLPVTVSLLVSKRLSPRWTIESGVSYTRLSSEETWESAELKEISTNNIKLHYLGIPLKASYLVFNKSRFSLYLSGGGMAEKCVSGKILSTFANTGLHLSSDLDVSVWQFSLTGNIGADFEIVKPISIFIEPGVVYYFDDGSEIMTIRKDKPFNFNIQGGLRLSF